MRAGQNNKKIVANKKIFNKPKETVGTSKQDVSEEEELERLVQ